MENPTRSQSLRLHWLIYRRNVTNEMWFAVNWIWLCLWVARLDCSLELVYWVSSRLSTISSFDRVTAFGISQLDTRIKIFFAHSEFILKQFFPIYSHSWHNAHTLYSTFRYFSLHFRPNGNFDITLHTPFCRITWFGMLPRKCSYYYHYLSIQLCEVYFHFQWTMWFDTKAWISAHALWCDGKPKATHTPAQEHWIWIFRHLVAFTPE